MKLKKMLTMGLSLALILGVTGCTKKEVVPEKTPTKTPTEEKGSVTDNEYVKQYSKVYNNFMGGVEENKVYLTPESATEYYATNEYPGNETYLENVKMAYHDTKEKIVVFVNSLKNDVKTDDAELNKKNQQLIAEGEKAIADIDAKTKKLDEIPKDAMSKTKEEYMKLVGEATMLKDNTKNEFSKLMEEINTQLGIKNK
ncbi:MAG: hypothetical protein ACRC3Y_14610 [Romboutsia sp.]|uniref:hypothetical protein n=1 Tax=Romboutsia sp. TaxID=1965302 RepID=UPI003F2A9BA0